MTKPRATWVAWIAAAILAALLPIAYFVGQQSMQASNSPSSQQDRGWLPVEMDPSCVGYAFDTPPSITLPPATSCTGRFRFLDRERPSVGYQVSVVIASADPSDIPAAWREDKVVGDWTYEGETQIPFLGQIEFTFLDEHGFEVAVLHSPDVQVRSGQPNDFQGQIETLTTEQQRVIRSAKAIVSLTRCYLCEPRPQ